MPKPSPLTLIFPSSMALSSDSLHSPALAPSGQGIPAKLLQMLVHSQATGRLMVQNPFDEFVYWQIYLGQGRIHVAKSVNGCRERLYYLMGKTLDRRNITLPPTVSDDYLYLCELWKNNLFSFQQIRSILTQSTQEALVQILSLPKTYYTYVPDQTLSDIFLNLDLDQTIVPVKHKIRYWWELRSDINSPFQRPLVENWETVYQGLVKNGPQGHHWLKRLHSCLKNLNCLYEIAGTLETSVLELALLLQPFVKTGEIKMLSYQEIEMDDRPLVAYVDPRESRQKMMGYFLDKSGFRSLILDNPFKALTTLLNTPPQLIIINVNLPDMNGYQLCSFCRKSSQLKQVPILLIGDQDSFLDKIRTKLSQASGYVSESSLPHGLLQKIQRLMGEGRGLP